MFSVKFYRPNRVRVIITQILNVFEEPLGELIGSDELNQGFLTNHANLPRPRQCRLRTGQFRRKQWRPLVPVNLRAV